MPFYDILEIEREGVDGCRGSVYSYNIDVLEGIRARCGGGKWVEGMDG